MDAPDDLVAWLRRYRLTAAAPVATTVDSQPATSIDVTNETSKDKNVFAFSTGNFHIPPGVRLRFTIIPMDGPDLAIYTGGPIEGSDAAIARTQPMSTRCRSATRFVAKPQGGRPSALSSPRGSGPGLAIPRHAASPSGPTGAE